MYRIWHFKCFNNLDFSQLEMCFLLAASITAKRIMNIEEAPYEVCFQFGKKLLLPGLLDSMLYKLDMQDPQENNPETLSKQGGFVL